MEAVFLVKSGRLDVLTLRLQSPDITAIQLALAKRFARAGDFVQMPFVLDLNDLSHPEALELGQLLAVFQGFGLKVVALCHRSGALAEEAQELGLVYLRQEHFPAAPSAAAPAQELATEAASQPQATPPAGAPAAASAPAGATAPEIAAPKAAKTLVITKPVRSGQQIYAPEADVIVTALVSEGAEIIAGGNVHIYGTMRGRVLAGVNDEAARIFIQCMQAQLVSVAGVYRTFEQSLPPALNKKAVQVYLEEGRLVLSALTAQG